MTKSKIILKSWHLGAFVIERIECMATIHLTRFDLNPVELLNRKFPIMIGTDGFTIID